MDFPEIEIEYCPQCKNCCHNIPTLICGFYILQSIDRGELDVNIKADFCIYQFPKKLLTESTRVWEHNFNPQLMQFLTIPNGENYELLAIVKTRGDCPLLGPEGCKYPSTKPTYCAQFPFFKTSNTWEIVSWCTYSENLELTSFMQKLENFDRETLAYSLEHQSEYNFLLNKLSKRYNWPVIHFK